MEEKSVNEESIQKGIQKLKQRVGFTRPLLDIVTYAGEYGCLMMGISKVLAENPSQAVLWGAGYCLNKALRAMNHKEGNAELKKLEDLGEDTYSMWFWKR